MGTIYHKNDSYVGQYIITMILMGTLRTDRFDSFYKYCSVNFYLTQYLFQVTDVHLCGFKDRYFKHQIFKYSLSGSPKAILNPILRNYILKFPILYIIEV